MFRTLTFIVCIARAEFWESGDSNNNQNGWLENLKRRLMSDNYDYEQSSADMEPRALDNNPSKAPMDTTTEPSTIDPAYDLLDALQDKEDRQIQFAYESAEKNINEEADIFNDKADIFNDKVDIFNDITTVHSLYAPRHRVDDVYFTPSVPQNSIDERDDVYGISRNDLQMYLKDAKIQDPDPVDVAPKNVSYKVLQPSLLSRRAGGAAPRFVEEVGASGVSLLSVDGAPFPEFQLPSARRQYQAAKDSAEDWLDWH